MTSIPVGKGRVETLPVLGRQDKLGTLETVETRAQTLIALLRRDSLLAPVLPALVESRMTLATQVCKALVRVILGRLPLLSALVGVKESLRRVMDAAGVRSNVAACAVVVVTPLSWLMCWETGFISRTQGAGLILI